MKFLSLKLFAIIIGSSIFSNAVNAGEYSGIVFKKSLRPCDATDIFTNEICSTANRKSSICFTMQYRSGEIESPYGSIESCSVSMTAKFRLQRETDLYSAEKKFSIHSRGQKRLCIEFNQLAGKNVYYRGFKSIRIGCDPDMDIFSNSSYCSSGMCKPVIIDRTTPCRPETVGDWAPVYCFDSFEG